MPIIGELDTISTLVSGMSSMLTAKLAVNFSPKLLGGFFV